MAVAVVTRYNRPVRGALLGFCMWAVLTFLLMPGSEPSNITALLVPGSSPDGAMALAGKGAMWVVAGALIGKTWERTGFFTSSYRRSYEANGLSAKAMAAKGAAEGAVIGFAMGAFISGLWDFGLIVPEDQSEAVSTLMVVVLVIIGTALGSIAGLSKWKKRALAGAALSCLSYVCLLALAAPTSPWISSTLDVTGSVLPGNLAGMMDAIEQNGLALLGWLPVMLLVVPLGVMLGAIRGVPGASRRVLIGFTIATGLVLLPLQSAASSQDLPPVEVYLASWIIPGILVFIGLGTLGGSIVLKIGGKV